MAMYFMLNSSKGISPVFLGKWIGVTQKSAWKIGHAIRAMMQQFGETLGPLEGFVELDEKYLGVKPRFIKGVTSPRGKGTRKRCIHVAVERQGTVNAEVVTGDSYVELSLRVAKAVSPEAHLVTDQLATYKSIGKEYASHESVNHGTKELCRDDVHVKTAESFNSLLERAKQGVFHYLRKGTCRGTSMKLLFVGITVIPWKRRPAREPSKLSCKPGLW